MNTIDLLNFIGKEPNEQLVKDIDKRFRITRHNNNRISLEQVFRYICDKYNIPYKDLFTKDRFRSYVVARQEGSYLATLLGYHVMQISVFLKKDRTTVLYYIDQVNDQMSINPYFKKRIQSDLEFLNNE